MLVVAAIYVSGLGNALVFDDERLSDGTIFGAYGSLVDLQPRLLSYGSFVWLAEAFGDGWRGQRVFNLGLHLLTALGLWLLVRRFMDTVNWPTDEGDGPSPESKSAAAVAGVALFALNPVAVYAVGYLIQRSILMATMFSVWAMVAVLAAARSSSLSLPALAGALALYLLAVLSKEHAVLLPVPAMALYLIVRRPPKRTVMMLAGASLFLAGAGALVLASYYSGVVGKVFDARSVQFIAQLEALQPGVGEQAHLLSIANQAWLFFKYGALWAIPNVSWMSADLRPPFPLSLSEFPQLLGIPLYLATLLGSVALMLRFDDWRRYLGFALFLPASLFATEFATVWVQDPFVLYRSYLWAMGLPFLFAFPFIGARPRTVMMIAGVLCAVFAGLSFERLQSFRSNATLWHDAAAKHEVPGEPNAVGKGRAFMWRGNDYFVKGMYGPALQDYDRALAAGEPPAQTHYHRAAALNMGGKVEAALAALTKAETAAGALDRPALLPLLQAQLLPRVNRFDEAIVAASAALALPLDDEERRLMLDVRAKSRVRLARHAEAVGDFRELVGLAPENRAARVGLALELRAIGELEQAISELDGLLEQGDGADVRFGRALVFMAMGRAEDALSEGRRALALKPGDPSLKGLVAKLQGQ